MAKRIAFVDYKLDNFHANTYLKAFRNQLKGRGYEVAGCHAIDEAAGKAWAEKNGVPYVADVLELNEQTDYFVVLAPSNPETHLELARRVLPFGKATYIDKTFAPDAATARQIFELADQHHAPVQTTSALRYTSVQKQAAALGGREKLKHLTAWGGGSSFAEYGIHPVEMTVSCLGPGAESLTRRGTDPYSQLLINFTGGRTATVNVYTHGDTPFMAELTTDRATHHVPVDLSTLFVDMAAAILDFFDAGEPQIDRAESLAIRRILDAAADPAALKGFVRL